MQSVLAAKHCEYPWLLLMQWWWTSFAGLVGHWQSVWSSSCLWSDGSRQAGMALVPWPSSHSPGTCALHLPSMLPTTSSNLSHRDRIVSWYYIIQFVPESARYYVVKGQNRKAEKVLKRVALYNCRKPLEVSPLCLCRVYAILCN